jgi:uncharacterized membrane protein
MGTLSEEDKAAFRFDAPVMSRPRLDAIDVVRGIVMVVMALDHVRGFFCRDTFTIDPVDLSQTYPALFLTRWVTHFCAPTFVFLAGTSAFLYGTRGKTKGAIAWFLVSRGIWLMLLDLTVVNWSWAFGIDYSHLTGGGIIWIIGAALVVLSLLVWLPTACVATIGVAIIAFHNHLDRITVDGDSPYYGVWSLLHGGGPFWIFPNLHGLFPIKGDEEKYGILLQFITGYRLLPWTGIVAAGYGFGALFLLDRPERRKQLIGLGVALTLLFAGLRYTNYYGDFRNPAPPDRPSMVLDGQPGPWTYYEKKDGTGIDWPFTALSFLNCQKYPPSLLFVLMTLGPAILAIGLFDRAITGPISRFFITFGRVPLFFYLLHIPLIHALAIGADYWWYGKSPLLNDGPWAGAKVMGPNSDFPDYGWSLPMIYLIWAIVVLLLYPFCWWFARVKQRYRSGLLSYL